MRKIRHEDQAKYEKFISLEESSSDEEEDE